MGVDACPGGWVGIVATASPHGVELAGFVGPSISSVVESARELGPLDVVAVDMPIGLSDETARAPDVLAKRLVHRRHASVFMTPPRTALTASSRLEADGLSRALTGKGVSAQAFALATKLFEVDAWARGSSHRVVEVHPEVSFATLAGRGLGSKKTWAGIRDRLALLAEAGFDPGPDLLPEDAKVAIDDVLDACVAAWTAQRVARDEALSFPDPPVTYGDGWPCAIWA